MQTSFPFDLSFFIRHIRDSAAGMRGWRRPTEFPARVWLLLIKYQRTHASSYGYVSRPVPVSFNKNRFHVTWYFWKEPVHNHFYLKLIQRNAKTVSGTEFSVIRHAVVITARTQKINIESVLVSHIQIKCIKTLITVSYGPQDFIALHQPSDPLYSVSRQCMESSAVETVNIILSDNHAEIRTRE